MPRMIRGATALFMLAVLFVAPACAEATKVTFLLVNDIYQMSAQAMPDGRTRGGFAFRTGRLRAGRAHGEQHRQRDEALVCREESLD